MKIVPYTAVLGGRDPIRKDVLCFTEQNYNKFTTPVMNAKIFKILAHAWVDTDVSVWMDGNHFLRVPVEKLVEDLLKDNDMALALHPTSRGIWEEAELIKQARPGQMKLVVEQCEHYTKRGLPRDFRVLGAGVIIRRHNENTKRLNELWWAEICRWSVRDQISLPYVVWSMPSLKLNAVPQTVLSNYMKMGYH